MDASWAFAAEPLMSGRRTVKVLPGFDVHVGRLRKALMAQGGGDPLRTVRGAGYALG